MEKNIDIQLTSGSFHDVLQRFGINYSDDVWVLPSNGAGVADARIKLNWNKLSLRDGNQYSLNDHYERLLKKVAAGLLAGGGRHYSPITIKSKLYFYRKLFNEMQTQGFEAIFVVDRSTVIKLFECWIAQCTSIKKGTVEQWVTNTNLLYEMKDFTEVCFTGRPILKKDVQRITSRLSDAGYWEAPPEPASIYLLRASIKFLNDHADEVLSLYYQYIAEIEDALSQGINTKKRVSRYVSSRISKVRYEKLVSRIGLCVNWRPEASSVAKLVNHISTACFIVITYTCGQRVSEIRRANSKSLVSRRHENGSEHVYYIAPRSKIRFSAANHSSEGTGHDDMPWILSPAAVDAFDILLKLSQPAREKSQIDSLWLTNYGNALWPFNPKKGFVVLGATAINFRLNSFAEFIQLSAATGWKGRLHSHMGRKHLARFVAKRDRSMLGDLARQYSHLSAESIDVSYARPDSEFRRMIQEELVTEMADLAATLLESADENIFTNGKSTRLTNFLGELRTTRDIRLLLSAGTKLYPCQWGVCFYAQETSACEGSKLNPNVEKRTPTVCAGCSNFASTPRHSNWWADFESDCKKIMRQRNIPQQTRLVLEQRLAIAHNVLTKTGGVRYE
jgi:hypothetical protein